MGFSATLDGAGEAEAAGEAGFTAARVIGLASSSLSSSPGSSNFLPPLAGSTAGAPATAGDPASVSAAASDLPEGANPAQPASAQARAKGRHTAPRRIPIRNAASFLK